MKIKIKHLVPLLFVGIHRDITTTVQAEVPEHEVLILQAVHGDSNVYPRQATGAMTHIDPDTEHERLVRKYGEDKVRDAYGATYRGDIRRLVLAASTGTEEVEGYGIQLEGPDSPSPMLTLPASEVQRPTRNKREAATA